MQLVSYYQADGVSRSGEGIGPRAVIYAGNSRLSHSCERTYFFGVICSCNRARWKARASPRSRICGAKTKCLTPESHVLPILESKLQPRTNGAQRRVDLQLPRPG